MTTIKQRRMNHLQLSSHPGLFVGDCVPFYFCPRSVMLYVLHTANAPALTYHGGQAPIIHLEADLKATIAWAGTNDKRWAFTLSNAGACYFEDRASLDNLHEISWDAVHANDWRRCKEGKQAEFLLEDSFPWHLVERVGVYSQAQYVLAANAIRSSGKTTPVEVLTDWYY